MCECRSPPGGGVGRSRPLRALRIAERYRRRRGRGLSLRGKNWLEPPPLAADDGLAAVEAGVERLQLALHGARGVAGGIALLQGVQSVDARLQAAAAALALAGQRLVQIGKASCRGRWWQSG